MTATKKAMFDFKFVGECMVSKKEDSLVGEFAIIQDGNVVGCLSVSNWYGKKTVSAETPDANFTIEEWITFMQEIKEQFQLIDSQSIMMNKFPQSMELMA